MKVIQSNNIRLIEANNKYYEECSIILLESSKIAESSYIGKKDGVLYYLNNNVKFGGVLKAQHLYIVSERKPVVGEWVLIPFAGKIPFIPYYISNQEDLAVYNDGGHKDIVIVATNNSSLNIPGITIDFITYYINSYNFSKAPKNCIVRYEWKEGVYSHSDCEICHGDGGPNNSCAGCGGHGSNMITVKEPCYEIALKYQFVDATAILTAPESKTYTEDEVIELMQLAIGHGINIESGGRDYEGRKYTSANPWIYKQLK